MRILSQVDGNHITAGILCGNDAAILGMLGATGGSALGVSSAVYLMDLDAIRRGETGEFSTLGIALAAGLVGGVILGAVVAGIGDFIKG